MSEILRRRLERKSAAEGGWVRGGTTWTATRSATLTTTTWIPAPATGMAVEAKKHAEEQPHGFQEIDRDPARRRMDRPAYLEDIRRTTWPGWVRPRGCSGERTNRTRRAHLRAIPEGPGQGRESFRGTIVPCSLQLWPWASAGACSRTWAPVATSWGAPLSQRQAQAEQATPATPEVPIWRRTVMAFPLWGAPPQG